jgi:hypothetical protein
LIILALICSSNAHVLASSFHVNKGSWKIMAGKAELDKFLFQPKQNITSASQTQNTTTGESGNASGFPQMPLPPVSEPKSPGTDYLSIAAIVAAVTLVAVVLLRFRRKKSS